MNVEDPLHVNSDFSQRVVVNTAAMDWIESGLPGVWRKRLDRKPGPVEERVTTVVQYAPGSRFSPHTHQLGEEFLVLEGTFSDEKGDYPAGTYVRNPPGSRHQPFSRDGCTILVKLGQFDPRDDERVVIDTISAPWYQGLVAGLKVQPLHEFELEHVALVRWAPQTYFNRHVHAGGEEIFVLEGEFRDEHGVYPAGTWLRSPHFSEHKPYSVTGCTILVKTGHLGAL